MGWALTSLGGSKGLGSILGARITPLEAIVKIILGQASSGPMSRRKLILRQQQYKYPVNCLLVYYQRPYSSIYLHFPAPDLSLEYLLQVVIRPQGCEQYVNL